MFVQKKSVMFLFIIILAFALSSGIYAQNASDGSDSGVDSASDADVDSDSVEEFPDAELETGAGVGPDSAFYFLDKFFDRFGDDLKIREEKIAEIKDMAQQGKLEEARIALERYRNYADSLEKEADPEKKDEVLRSSAAIKNAVTELEEELSEEDKKDFVDDVIDREGRITSATEISSKIKELCETLSGLDPLEYSRICKTDDDSSDWQRKLDKDLTDEQREEAKKFGKIMQQCFETAGQQCACDEIPFADFAQTCSIAAPLATACEIEGNEEACMQIDELEMPELPPHLQDVMDELENDVSGSRIDLHMPSECREAGATNPNECRKIMIETNAPEECRQALIDANVKNEREGREICEKIMFEQNAPPECIEAGLMDHKECGLFMFKETAPQECLDAGLTGERQSDHKKCREIMDNLGGDRRGPNSGPGFGSGNCREIQNSEERLACYDGALQGVHEQRNNFDEGRRENEEAMRMCANKCLSAGAAWDFSNGNCECRSSERFDDSEFKEEFRSSDSGSFDGGEFRQPPEGEFQQPPEGEFGTAPEGEFQQQPEGTEGVITGGETTTDGEGSTSTTDSGATTEPSSGDGVVGTGNAFLDYFSGR